MFPINNLFEFLLYDNYTSARTTMHDFYMEEENIDILFLGSSHAYASFDTNFLDNEFQKNTFNLGTGDQQLDGSLLLLKEANKYNKIQEVYLDMYFRIALDPLYKERTGFELGCNYIISDNLKWSWDKFLYLLNSTSSDEYVLNFIPARRRWYNLFDFANIKDNINTKTSENYKNYIVPDNLFGNGTYYGKGYIALESSDVPYVSEKHYFNFTNIEILSKDWSDSLLEIIEYCQKNNIKLTLLTTPMPEFLLADIPVYDEYIKLLSNICQKNKIKYYDFNLCKPEFLQLERTDYYDATHLSYSGVEKFNRVFADLINGKLTDEIFYSSYKEKLENERKQIYGLILNDDASLETWEIEPITNIAKSEILYSVSFRSDNGDIEQIQNLSYNNYISYKKSTSGMYIIECFINEEKNIGTYSINYSP